MHKTIFEAMPPLDTMMPCELLSSRSVDFSLIASWGSERHHDKRSHRERGRHREKGRWHHCKRCCSKNRGRKRCHCEEHLSLWMLRFGTIHAIRSPNHTIQTRYRNKSDSSNDSYHGAVESFRIVRFVSWIVRYLLPWGLCSFFDSRSS